MIRIPKALAKKIKARGKMGDTYASVLDRLLNKRLFRPRCFGDYFKDDPACIECREKFLDHGACIDETPCNEVPICYGAYIGTKKCIICQEMNSDIWRACMKKTNAEEESLYDSNEFPTCPTCGSIIIQPIDFDVLDTNPPTD